MAIWSYHFRHLGVILKTASTPVTQPQAVGHVGFGQQPKLEDFTHEEQVRKLLTAILLEQRRQRRALFNASNIVNEVVSSLQPFAGPIIIQRDFDLPELITSILVSLPTGITAASLQLGQFFLPLYTGAALAAQLLVNPTGLGYLLNPSDPRILSFTGAPTSGFSIALMGTAFEREGQR